jgi:KRAB domain-containing zinc finger protein
MKCLWMKKKHLCGHCGKTFQTSSVLTRHERGHRREKPYTCDICGMQFNERGNFQGHFNSHAKIKSCKCDKCGKSYQYRSSLLRHTLSCNGLEVVNTHNSFECPTCKTTFQRKDTLSDHIHRAHQKKQKYRCNNCNRSFLWRSSLAHHKCQNMW